MFPTWSDWDITYTPKGRAKRTGMRVTSILTLVAVISGILRLRQAAQGRGLRSVIAELFREFLLKGSNILQKASSKV